ncbi:MAG: aminotransferase class I/II-fold pyridoxal phosphate-dependent enzyme [Acidobacteriota bacterium]
MRIDRFRMERTQSLYENAVRYNLSESGVEPLRVEELLESEGDRTRLLQQPLKYPESNGSQLLRERIALLYPGAAADNVLVTTGTSEANYTALWGLLEAGDRAAVMLPTYMQAWGLARAYGGRADAYRLVERGRGSERRWALDVASLRRAVTKRTRLIMVTNPNNPTGAVLTEEEMDEIVAAARRVKAWIVSDEVYRGAEVGSDTMSPTFWGRYSKVLITSGLSKAFGLPGLRIGWIAGPAREIGRLWSYQDYTTLTPSMLSDRLARAALDPQRREEILARTRRIIRENLPRVQAWIGSNAEVFGSIAPVAGAIALVKYRLPIGSVALFDRLRLEESVLVTPGAHFGIGKYFRVGFGYDVDRTLEGLARIQAFRRPRRRGRAAPQVWAGRARGGFGGGWPSAERSPEPLPWRIPRSYPRRNASEFAVSPNRSRNARWRAAYEAPRSSGWSAATKPRRYASSPASKSPPAAE